MIYEKGYGTEYEYQCARNSVNFGGDEPSPEGFFDDGTSGVVEFTAENFEEKIARSQNPVMVDFYAPWCGPCKRLAPLIEKFGTEMGDRITVGRLNVDDAADVADRYRIRSIPTVAMFRDGELTSRAVGVRDYGELEELASR